MFSYIRDNVIHHFYKSLEVIEVLKRIFFGKYRVRISVQVIGTRSKREARKEEYGKYVNNLIFHLAFKLKCNFKT